MCGVSITFYYFGESLSHGSCYSLGVSISGSIWDSVGDEFRSKDNTLTHEEAHAGKKSISHLQRSPDRAEFTR